MWITTPAGRAGFLKTTWQAVGQLSSRRRRCSIWAARVAFGIVLLLRMGRTGTPASGCRPWIPAATLSRAVTRARSSWRRRGRVLFRDELDGLSRGRQVLPEQLQVAAEQVDAVERVLRLLARLVG
jgi:hypothetical protein